MADTEMKLRSLEVNSVEIIQAVDGMHVFNHVLVHGVVITRRTTHADTTGDLDPRQNAVSRFALLNNKRETRRPIINGGKRFRPFDTLPLSNRLQYGDQFPDRHGN